jgi:TorA maturation chaperone TorD
MPPNAAALANAWRVLAHFWLAEVQPADLELIILLPELVQTLPQPDQATLTDLAVEYQRLFGFSLPAYESIFVDPTVMLLAPATARVQTLYHQAGWQPPANVRIGAPDHLGVELLALADGLKQPNPAWADQLHHTHLALWVPACILTLTRLQPQPFYTALGDLTLELLLATLKPEELDHRSADPFPTLPPAPRYNQYGQLIPLVALQEEPNSLAYLVKRLLTPCQAGLFLTREDIARIGQALNLPPVLGERSHMLETLFHLAGQYEVIAQLLDQLQCILSDTATTYQDWANRYPAWQTYARAWLQRLDATQKMLIQMNRVQNLF